MTESITTKSHTFAVFSGESVTIDAADRDLVEAAGPWYALRRPRTTYVTAHRRRPAGTLTTVLLHRLLLNPPDGVQVDHVNRDGLDNRRANLRTCTQSQNMANSPPQPGCSSEFKGIYWNKTKSKWRARGRDLDGKKRHLGYFVDELEAARSYDVHAATTWGEFAWLNADHFDLSGGDA